MNVVIKFVQNILLNFLLGGCMQLRLRFQEPAGERGNRVVSLITAPGPGIRRLLPRANWNEEQNRLPKRLSVKPEELQMDLVRQTKCRRKDDWWIL